MHPYIIRQLEEEAAALRTIRKRVDRTRGRSRPWDVRTWALEALGKASAREAEICRFVVDVDPPAPDVYSRVRALLNAIAFQRDAVSLYLAAATGDYTHRTRARRRMGALARERKTSALLDKETAEVR